MNRRLIYEVSIMGMNDLLNKRNQFVGVITGEAMRIEKCLYDNLNELDEVIMKPKARPKTFKNAKTTISNGLKWVTEDYIIYENRYRIPIMNIYFNDELIIENQPVYFGNYELRTKFKLGDIVVFSAVVEKFDTYGYEPRSGYTKLIHYVDKDQFYFEFGEYFKSGIHEEDAGNLNINFEFTKTRLMNNDLYIGQNAKNDSERVIKLEQEKEAIKKQQVAEKRRQKRLEKQLKEEQERKVKEEEERRVKEEQERLEHMMKERERVYDKLVSYYMGLKYSVDASCNKAAEIINKYYML